MQRSLGSKGRSLFVVSNFLLALMRFSKNELGSGKDGSVLRLSSNMLYLL